MKYFFEKNFYPQNFILPGPPGRQAELAEKIVAEARSRFPEKFAGKTPSFPFELRYVPPFDRGFFELKRLQGTAAAAAGRRDEFLGYIVIDLSAYLSHEAEPYFELSLRFLIDRNDCWKYIFLTDDRNRKAAAALIGRTLDVLLRDVPCAVVECGMERILAEEKTDEICREQGVICAPAVREFFQELSGREEYGPRVVRALLRELSGRYGQPIGLDALAGCLEETDPVVKYMLSSAKYSGLMDIYRKRKELWYGEKEAI